MNSFPVTISIKEARQAKRIAKREARGKGVNLGAMSDGGSSSMGQPGMYGKGSKISYGHYSYANQKPKVGTGGKQVGPMMGGSQLSHHFRRNKK